MYKMKITNQDNNKTFYIRSRIVHSLKAAPGFEILKYYCFISQQQANYLYSVLEEKDKKVDENEKLWIQGDASDLKGVGAAIVTMSPEHTQMFEISFIAHTF